MTICTSGDNYSNHNIATKAYDWFNRYSAIEFKVKEIEVHYCDLTDDNVPYNKFIPVIKTDLTNLNNTTPPDTIRQNPYKRFNAI